MDCDVCPDALPTAPVKAHFPEQAVPAEQKALERAEELLHGLQVTSGDPNCPARAAPSMGNGRRAGCFARVALPQMLAVEMGGGAGAV